MGAALVIILLMIYCLFYFVEKYRKLEERENVSKRKILENKLFKGILFFGILLILLVFYMRLILNIFDFYGWNNYIALLLIVSLSILFCIMITVMMFENAKVGGIHQFLGRISIIVYFFVIIINIVILFQAPFSVKKVMKWLVMKKLLSQNIKRIF